MMSYELLMKISGWIDMVLGIGGLFLIGGYDFLNHMPLHIGFWAKAGIVICFVFIYKGKKLIDFAS